MPGSHRRTLLTVATAAATSVLLALTQLGGAPYAFAATLFTDDFSDGNTSGWSKSGGTWSLVADDGQALQQAKGDTDNARLFAGTTSWTDYTVQARVKPLTLPANGAVALLARASGATTYLRLALLPGNQVRLEAVRSGTATVLGSASRSVATGTWYTLRIEIAGSAVRGYVDGTLVTSGTSPIAGTGRIGVQTLYATARYDDVAVTSGGTTPTTPPTTPPTATPTPTITPTPPPTTGPPPSGQSSVVAKDGSGNFTSVQAAVNAVPTGNSSRYTITIKPGTYRELVSIPAGKPYISFVGSTGNATDVVITYDNASGTPAPGGGTYGTSGSASVTIDGNDFTARNLTFSNSFDESAYNYSAEQAVAVLTRADRLVFDNVRFLGNQDTLYPNSANASTIGRSYYRNCYVEGDVDFIFGRGTAVFDRCEIKALSRGSSSNNGYVTAPSTMISNTYGFLFVQCTLTTDSAAAQSVHLGRPWHPSGDVNAIGQVVFRDSVLGAHIKNSPWTDMSGFSWRDARFFEYRNSGPGATVTADRPQLTDAQAPNYTAPRYLAGPDGWNPIY
ncbi:pectinesterase family protein [Micromonospora sp. NBC_01796]|uniref:pectinesterase family protein n=1 Tax=Micromonospora sp. NBC_01796 TaxID=2975987 RepID=UPI002DDC5113|nr:pectinesterase family protein [Micromonospora sp. NBC_01796]WSA83061.1 pectinesterase family protein [Micromonospora sp. NBC_01796]